MVHVGAVAARQCAAATHAAAAAAGTGTAFRRVGQARGRRGTVHRAGRRRRHSIESPLLVLPIHWQSRALEGRCCRSTVDWRWGAARSWTGARRCTDELGLIHLLLLLLLRFLVLRRTPTAARRRGRAVEADATPRHVSMKIRPGGNNGTAQSQPHGRQDGQQGVCRLRTSCVAQGQQR